jgi:hypothetical protein
MILMINFCSVSHTEFIFDKRTATGLTVRLNKNAGSVERYGNHSLANNFRLGAHSKFIFDDVGGTSVTIRRTPGRSKNAHGVDLITFFRTDDCRKSKLVGGLEGYDRRCPSEWPALVATIFRCALATIF